MTQCLQLDQCGYRCRHEALPSGFCKAHLPGERTSAPPPSSHPAERCRGLRADGLRCWGRAGKSGFCGQHALALRVLRDPTTGEPLEAT
jgi:hypothetical protein